MNFKSILFFVLILLTTIFSYSQTKVKGIVVDEQGQPVPFANVVFKGSNQGIVTNEDGRFYLESKETYRTLVVAFVGFDTKEFTLPKAVNYDFKAVMTEGTKLKEVVVYSGKTSKKENPALDILRKIWERKRKNGLNMFDQYQMEKYEKVEFDMNSIDSAFMKNRIFKGLEFIFDQVDTSKVTGKTYLPMFINESLADVYGDNTIPKTKEILKANRNSGFSNNQQVLAFIKDLYSDYDIYDNYLKFFDKSFTSPLSRTGIDVYNYRLVDTAFIDNKWCYNIVFYPRRKSELTFKGDFWVNDTTFAIKKINMGVTKSANINWVKDIYIEQEFDVLNDSVFLLTKDYLMSDFAFSKREKSKGVYGKRTTYFRNHRFDIKKPAAFYNDEVNQRDLSTYIKPDDYWDKNRFEKLSKDEVGVYKMLDTLKTLKKFKQYYSYVQILASGYVEIDRLNFDYGPIFSTVGFNEVEGWRLRTGGRTYFGPNDLWRIEGYTAYGFDDHKFKYGLSGKVMLDKRNRIILSGGNRRDVEQIGASLTTTNDVLGRSFASSSVFSSGSNGKLTNINLTTLDLGFEPVKNLTFSAGVNYRTLVSASPTFSLDYYTDSSRLFTKSEVKQLESTFTVDWTPNREVIGYGVERGVIDNPYSRVFLSYSNGIKGGGSSDFDYKKLQLYYSQPITWGLVGRSYLITEVGRTFGAVPLGLMSIVPGNQTYFTIDNTFSNLNFYEFVTDQYVTMQLTHNFQGKIFARVPLLRKLNWREIVGLKAVYGTISDENRALNASGLIYRAPEDVYYEYSAGIGNIFKVFRLDFSWRGNYRNLPDAPGFAIKGSFGFSF